jgi:hypothetical protein
VILAGEVTSIEPTIESIKLKGRLIGTFDAIAARLVSLQMFSIKSTQSNLTIIRVESRNIQKRPFLFMVFKLDKESIGIDYSIGFDSSVKIRRLYVLKNLIAILSLITDIYDADNTDLLQHLDSAIDDVLGSLTQEYSALFNNYDSLFNKYRELKRLNIELINSNKNLSVQASLLEGENVEIKDRLKALETYSDESLMAIIEEWIDSRGGSIDINEFANNYKITAPRVEQMLNKMVSLGYIELKG